MLSTYHVLHVGGRWVDLTTELVVQVQNEVHVPFADGPLPPWPGPPPLVILVPVLVQDGLKTCGGVGEDHGQDGLCQAQEQACCSHPAQESKRTLHDEANRAAEGQILFVFCETQRRHVELVLLAFKTLSYFFRLLPFCK